MYITAFKVKSDSEAKCNMGKFKALTKKATVFADNCETVLKFDSTRKKGLKKVKGMWIAPKSNGCDIVMR